jgi:hypothetical protein
MAHVLRQVRVRGELEWLAAAQLMRRFVGYIWVRRILEPGERGVPERQ